MNEVNSLKKKNELNFYYIFINPLIDPKMDHILAIDLYIVVVEIRCLQYSDC